MQWQRGLLFCGMGGLASEADELSHLGDYKV